MAQMICTAVVWIFAFGESDSWDIATTIASVPITIFGILYLKKQNGGSFGNRFLSKYFCLGWVISVRMLLLAMPTMIVVFVVVTIIGGDDALDPVFALFAIAVEVLFYWWLGSLFSQSNRLKSEQDPAPNRCQHTELKAMLRVLKAQAPKLCNGTALESNWKSAERDRQLNY